MLSGLQVKLNMNLIRFYSILSNFCQILLQKNCFIIVNGDFNARATVWWRNNITTTEGTNIDSTASSYGVSQIICDAIHILSTSSSFIDLTFSNQANLVIENGIDLSLCLSLSHSLSLFFSLSLYLSLWIITVTIKLSILISILKLNIQRLIREYKNTNKALINRRI